MNRRAKRYLLVGTGLILIIICVSLAHSLIWGKLFPYSPIIIGFDRQELSRVIVYTEKGNRFKNFEWLDSLPPAVEEFHELKFRTKPKIFFFAASGSYARSSISNARLCAFYNGAIVVSPWAQEENAQGKISLSTYLAHELSHSILYQNMNLFRALHYPRWLLEGVATYSANQMGTFPYPSRDETYALIRRGNWMPPEYYETNKEKDIQLDLENKATFIYSQFACIVDDLITRFGRATFLGYLKLLLTEGKHQTLFKASFGSDFNSYLKSFRLEIESSLRP